jgi:hypothetical protein
VPVHETRGERPQKRASPSIAGKYSVKLGGETQIRAATLDPEELTALPKPALAQAGGKATATARGQIDASRELGMFLIGLMVLELVVRAIRAGRGQRAPA